MGHPHFLWSDLFRKRKSDQSTLIDALKENVLFSTLSRQELKYLARIVYERVYEPDEPIFHQNDRGFGMYLIRKGRICIRTEGTAEKEPALKEHYVTTLLPGSFFGELSLVDPNNIRSASAIAIERSTIIGFFKPDLLEILERKPTMGVKILYQLAEVLGHRLLETTEKITSLRTKTADDHKKIHGKAV